MDRSLLPELIEFEAFGIFAQVLSEPDLTRQELALKASNSQISSPEMPVDLSTFCFRCRHVCLSQQVFRNPNAACLSSNTGGFATIVPSTQRRDRKCTSLKRSSRVCNIMLIDSLWSVELQGDVDSEDPLCARCSYIHPPTSTFEIVARAYST